MTQSKKKPEEIEDGTEWVEWIHMGQWPCFVGFTDSEKAFKDELKRLGICDLPFLGSDHAHATTTPLVSKHGKTCYIITMNKYTPSIGRNTYLALLAHEITHVIQYMQDDYAQGKRLGVEAEAYLMQYLMILISDIVFAPKKYKGTISKVQPSKDGK